MHLNVSNLLIVHLEQGEGRNLTIQIISVQNHVPATPHTQCTAQHISSKNEWIDEAESCFPCFKLQKKAVAAENLSSVYYVGPNKNSCDVVVYQPD